MAKEVVALRTGIYNGRRREGDIFEVEDNAKASWFTETKTIPTARRGKRKDPDPVSLGQAGVDTSTTFVDAMTNQE